MDVPWTTRAPQHYIVKQQDVNYLVKQPEAPENPYNQRQPEPVGAPYPPGQNGVHYQHQPMIQVPAGHFNPGYPPFESPYPPSGYQ